MTYRELLKEGERRLKEAAFSEAELDAFLLFEEAFHMSRPVFFLRQNEVADEREAKCYEEMIIKRLSHIPVSQILHKAWFMKYEFFVNEHVLSPRQDTEILVEEALHHLQDYDRVLDMCTGSGCIAISLYAMGKEMKKDFFVTACDLSEDALMVAKKNNEDIAGGKVRLFQGDLFSALPIKEDKKPMIFDMIVSNPPYIKSSVIADLMPEVKDHEPLMALDGCEDGLLFYRRIASEGKLHLRAGGFLIVEIGYDQGISVPEIFKAEGYEDIRVIRDFSGLDRVVCAKRG